MSIEFRRVRPADSGPLARLHHTVLPEGVIARFGPLFMEKVFYGILLEREDFAAYVCLLDGRFVGFIAGTTNASRLFRDALSSNPPRVAAIVALSLLRRPWQIPRILMAVREVVAGKPILPDVPGQIVAFGVAPECRTVDFLKATGIRIADRLYVLLMGFLRSRGVSRYKAGTVEGNTLVQVFYAKRNATMVTTARHSGKVYLWYVGDVPAET
jgi:ribosomal protein S18 acetylase RimI-like enzyme